MRTGSFCVVTAICAVLTASAAAFAADAIKIPQTMNMPVLEPLVPPCADPAADHFIEIDISQRPPAGSARVQRISGWVTADGVLHWPFVMRVRNIGDQVFIGTPGKQSAQLIEKDLAKGTTKTLATVPFDRVPAHSGVAVRFEFDAPAKEVEKGKFHRLYTLEINYGKQNDAIANPRYGDCNMRNNSFSIELDGSRPKWIYAK